jgi:SAM-dependent methyltransferase
LLRGAVTDPRVDALIDAATRPFAAAGRFARYFARGKLRHDPVYLALLERGVFSNSTCVLDVGCGQGILLSLLLAAHEQYRAGMWPKDWPAPPDNLQLRGIEMRRADVRRARLALGAHAKVEQRDVRDGELAPSDVVVLLDVLHYLDHESQELLLARAVRALKPQGVLIARVGDAARGAIARLTRIVDYVVAAARDRRVTPLHMRTTNEWLGSLERLGMQVTLTPMSHRTPFANVLLIAQRNGQ